MESLQKKYSTTEIIGGVVSKEIIQVEKKKRKEVQFKKQKTKQSKKTQLSIFFLSALSFKTVNAA